FKGCCKISGIPNSTPSNSRCLRQSPREKIHPSSQSRAIALHGRASAWRSGSLRPLTACRHRSSCGSRRTNVPIKSRWKNKVLDVIDRSSRTTNPGSSEVCCEKLWFSPEVEWRTLEDAKGFHHRYWCRQSRLHHRAGNQCAQ